MTPVAQKFRESARRIASTVAVIAAVDEQGGTAMTATAVSTLSMDPPSLLICVNKAAGLYKVLSRGAGFSVNFLNASQEAVARLCSSDGSRARRIEDASFETQSVNGVPTVQEALVTIICKQVHSHEYGSHGIFIGEVEDLWHSSDAAPLLYCDGAYRVLADLT